jgi:hypothetical protein
MKLITHKINIGQLQLRFHVGDQDDNGCLDFSFGFRVLGSFGMDLPPINLDAKLAEQVANLFSGVAGALNKKK